MPNPRTSAEADLGRRLVRALAGAHGDADATEAVLREVATTVGAPLAALWLLDESTGLLVFRHDWTAAEDMESLRTVMRRLTFAPGVGLPGMVLVSRKPAWVDDVRADDNFPRADVVRRAGLRRAIAAPVTAPDGFLGVLEVFGREPGEPGPEEVEDVALAAGQLGAYLARLRVEDRLRLSEESAASIVQAALDCIVTMDHRGDVVDFNAAAEATFGFRRADAVGRPLAELIIPPEFREAHRLAMARYVQTGRPTIMNRRLELSGLRADGTQFPVELTVSRLGTSEPPMFVGFLRDISDRRELEGRQSRALQEALVARAQAEAAGVRADHAREEAERARADEERARQRLAFLAQAGRILAESMDWETTLRAVVRAAVPAVAHWSAVSVLEPNGRLRVVALAHEDAEHEQLAWQVLKRYPPQLSASRGIGHVVRTGELEVLADMTPADFEGLARDDHHRRLLETIDPRHAITVPLRTASKVIGALTFVRSDPRWRFTTEDVELVTSLTARAALHLHNARLYTERSHIAATLQASLRPRALPEVPGAQIAAGFLPAGDQHEVGGDFYDVFLSADGVWTAVIGDVSGKGAEAAAVTALARHTLRTASMLHDDPPANLALLNRALHGESPSAGFCTVFYARLCPGAEGIEVRFSNGGHPAPLLLRADGTLHAVDAGRGPLVGAVEDAVFREASLRLEPGDLLLLYTDGVTEVRTSDPHLGERELRATVQRMAGATPEEVVAAVQQRALELQGGRQRDDIAVLALKAS